MSRYGSLNDFWPYAAGVTGACAVVLVLVYRFGILGARRGAGWKYTAEIDAIRKLMREKRYDEAASMVAPLLRKHDITAEFFDVAAVIATHRDQPGQAEKYWRAMCRYYPAEPHGYVRVARLLLRQGKTREAHRLLARASQQVKHTGQLDSLLAEAAQAEKRWDEAIRLWAELRVHMPTEVSGYLQGRICLLAAGRRAEADALLEDVAARMPNHPLVKQALAAAEKAAKAAG
jgi:predicted Zn-dependent protease